MPATAAPALDLEHNWLPFTPNRDFRENPRLFARAEGVHYYTPDGRAVLDGSSGLFTTPAGHARREIADAVHKQLLELDFSPSFQRSHPKAFEASGRCAALMPDGVDKIFFCNSGSEAVDTAMKIALAYFRAKGQATRTVFVSRERAYHGVGFGGVALSGLVNNRRTFGPGLPQALHMRHTHMKDPLRSVTNIYGSAELGTMAMETPLSILLRRLAVNNQTPFEKIFGDVKRITKFAHFIQ